MIQTKQYLAVLIPCGRALILNLLRWGGEIRSFEQLNLPPLDAKAAGIKDAEMTMAMQLIEDMTRKWDADNFRNSFADEINKLSETKAEAGDIADVVKVEREAGAPAGAVVLALTSLLKRSLEGGGRKPSPSRAADGGSASVTALPSAKRAPAKTATAAKKAPARKAPAAKSAPAKKTGRRAA